MSIHLIDDTGQHFFFKLDDVKCIQDGGRIDIDHCTVHLDNNVSFTVFMKTEEVIRIVTEAMEREV